MLQELTKLTLSLDKDLIFHHVSLDVLFIFLQITYCPEYIQDFRLTVIRFNCLYTFDTL